jgi:hypothetical protein
MKVLIRRISFWLGMYLNYERQLTKNVTKCISDEKAECCDRAAYLLVTEKNHLQHINIFLNCTNSTVSVSHC